MAVQGVLAIGGMALGIVGALGGIMPPVGRWGQQLQNHIWPNGIPDFFSLVDMVNRGLIENSDYTDAMRKSGFHEQYSIPLREMGRQYLQAGDYITAYHRGFIGEEFLDMYLERTKMGKFERVIAEKISWFQPGPADLVRFAVREVYSPQIAEKFGLFEDLPQNFITEARKTGMNKDQARNFWAAHWELPSIQMGFEMLHRRVIDMDTMKLLLRAADVMPFWRDKLIDISYRPLTRVDVRRMYGLGVLDREDVYNSYLDVGYSPDNAERMTDFTILYESDETTGLSRSNIVNAFKDDIISKEELISYLKAFRYNDKIIEFWVDVAEYEKAFEDVKQYVSDLSELYQMGAIDIPAMKQFLLNEDLPSRYIDTVINKVVKLKAKRTKVPSKEDLNKWLDSGYIDDVTYVQKMRSIGYKDDDIEIYLTIATSKADTSERKYLPIKTYSRWVMNGIMSVENYVKTAHEMGLTDEDIEKLLIEITEGQNEIN